MHTRSNVNSVKDMLPWQGLIQHAERLGGQSLSALVGGDEGRFARMSFRHGMIHADFSKQLIDSTALTELLALARQTWLGAGIESLFEGLEVNATEGRAALHMALRGSCKVPVEEQGRLEESDKRIYQFVKDLLSGRVKGASGKSIRLVVNLGIGGADLGPRMAVEALAPHPVDDGPRVVFVANIDPCEMEDALRGEDPETTLFIVSSKSFKTEETLANAHAAIAWLRAGLGDDADIFAHFAAVTHATHLASVFGVHTNRIFHLPEWVGGRYSVWSATGLPLLIALGESGFQTFLAGARDMDEHFRTAPLDRNLPVLMGLVGIWNASFLMTETLAVLPYAHRLRNFPAWLQQLEMESNGKGCTVSGLPTTLPTAPIVWGGVGTNGQHAFHQLLYQGTRRVAVDFVVVTGRGDERQMALVENALAQSAALMKGQTIADAHKLLLERGVQRTEAQRLAPHMACHGNQPSTLLVLPELTPYTLGQLMALYEHKVFVFGWVLGINSFDQYGVELGKDLARVLRSGSEEVCDASTASMLSIIKDLWSTVPAVMSQTSKKEM